MKNGAFHSAGRLDVEMFINRFRVQRFVFTAGGAEFDITDFTWSLNIKQNPGQKTKWLSLTTSGGGLSFPAYETNVLEARFEAVQVNIPTIKEGPAYWELVRTDTNEVWISGNILFKYGLLDSAGDDNEVTVSLSNETVSVELSSVVNSGGSGDIPDNFIRTNATQAAEGNTVIEGGNFNFDFGTTLSPFGLIKINGHNFEPGGNLITNGSLTLDAGGGGTVAVVFPNTGDFNVAYLGSPAFTGTPTAPTASPQTNNTQIATTAYVDSIVPAVAVVNRAAVQSLTNGTITSISFDAEILDNGSIWTSGSPTRLTVPSGSGQLIASVSAQVFFALNGTGRRRMFLYKNGAIIGPSINMGQSTNAHADSGVFLSCTWMEPCVAGDYFEIRVDQSSGANLDVQGRAEIAISKI